MAKQTVTLSGYKGGSAYMNGKYHVSTDDTMLLTIVPMEWEKKYGKAFVKSMTYGTPNQNIRAAIFKKLGIDSNAGEGIFVPHEHYEATGKWTFGNKPFAEIRRLQRKYRGGLADVH